ncbi:MAG: transglycosylase domain-containing protein, partial [Christensenella sp.]|uniref:transglycosylase domain-containing protein n=1 Tax=Christensenella sp. TaxID=1935934 RepID=UPI002B1EA5EE
DFRRLMGAFLSNVSSGTSEGGSTITQQLVKNKLLSNERSYKRKLQEAYLATELEKKYTKDEILEAYLNAIPLGGTVYGVKTAAKDYFAKDLSELNLREMTMIAAITQNPTKYNPRLATYKYPEHLPGLINRMNIIAERMYWAGMITEEEYQAVQIPAADYLAPECLVPGYTGDKILKDGYLDTWKEMMNIQPESPANELYLYPHFVEYVINDVQTFLLKKEGLEDTEANRQKVDREMRAGGYEIYTTLNPTIQDTVQNTLANYDNYPKLPDGVATEITDSNGIVTPQPQSAAAVIDNETGYLVAIVGSKDTPTIRRSINRANEGLQVGSSMKPLAVYGPAFDLGYGPVSSVANIPVPITGWLIKDGSEGAPDITGTQGPMMMRDAIVDSRNVAAARTLMDYVTIDKSVEYLHLLGIPDENITPTGVGLALGGSEVTPIQMTAAYAAIANEGEYRQPVSFTSVRDANKNVIIDTTTDRDVHQAFKPSTAYMLTDVLEQAVREGTGTDANLSGMTTAGKTGTVGDNKGITFAGYTPYYTSMVWVGHDQNKSLGKKYFGGGAPAELWNQYMQKIHENLPDKQIIDGTPEDFNINTNARVCAYTNLAPGAGCPVFTGWMLSGTEPTKVCDLHSSSTIKMCGVSGKRFIEGVCPEETAYEFIVSSFPADSPYAKWKGSGSGLATATDPSVAEGGTSYSSGGDPNTDCDVHFPGWNTPVETPEPSPSATVPPAPTHTPAPTPPAPTTDPAAGG